MKLSKSAKEVLKGMQNSNQEFIYIGMLGVEGLANYGMSVGKKIRKGIAENLIKNGLAERVNNSKVRLTELGKTIKLV